LKGRLEVSATRRNGLRAGIGHQPSARSGAEAEGYDLGDGDAQYLTGLEDESYDFVYSSHCLEHMRDPLEALLNWWRVLKPGGYLIVAVPDEDLYEQGIVPSVFNPDHKITFTISKQKSWSPVSRNLVDLLRHLPRHKVISLRTIDAGYDYEKLGTGEDQTLGAAEAAIELVVEKVKEELQLHTRLSALLTCSKCKRLEITALGWDSEGRLKLTCRSCGTPGEIRLRKDATDSGARASNGRLAEASGSSPARPAKELEAPIADLWHRALGHFKAQELTQARSLCNQILQCKPDHADALHLKGAISIQQGDRGAGVDFLRKSIEVAPSRTDYHVNLSQVLLEDDDCEGALFHLRRATEIEPKNFLALNHLGVALLRKGEIDGALDVLHRALRVRLDHSRTWLSLGKALLAVDRVDEAILALRIAVNIEGENEADHPEAWYHLGRALDEKGDLDKAVAAYRSALQAKPKSLESLHGLGHAFARQWRIDDALGSYQDALLIDPEHVPTLLGLGSAHHQTGRFSRAEEFWDRALSICPDNSLAKLGLGVLSLMNQDFERGWRLYESRLTDKFHRQVRGKLSVSARPEWQGESLSGKTILVYAEQGYGDVIQFVRYLPLLHGQGARVILGTPPVLETLLAGSDLKAEIAAADVSTKLPIFDCFVALLSLPHRFRTDLSTLPSPGVYLRADLGKVARYRREHFDHEDLKIGIAWQGNPNHPFDRIRSIPLACLSPLWALEGTRVYSLQTGPGLDQLSAMQDADGLQDLGSSFADFSDTAAAIENLDLVICADTAVAHLAGALGKETWILLPTVADWRWFLDRQDSPWYSSVRLFRQTKCGHYDSVVAEVLGALKESALLLKSPGNRAAVGGSVSSSSLGNHR